MSASNSDCEKATETTHTFGLVSLGCPKNLVDTEKIAALLIENGFILSEDPGAAEIVIINTCSFIAPAREESDEIIREFAQMKKTGKIRKLIVTGCLVQQTGKKIFNSYPEIDAALSFSAYSRIHTIIKKILKMDLQIFEGDRNYKLTSESPRLVLSGPFTAYLRISEGCSNRCTFCTIPSIRGPLRSKPEEAILAEARDLAGIGIKEIILIGQDTTAYGEDVENASGLPLIMEKMASVENIRWLRLMYTNPSKISNDLIQTIAGNVSIVKYIDMPIQHISDPVLRRMGRNHNETQTREIIDRLHETIPSLALRTSLMLGFPGETHKDYKILLNFVEEGHFQRLGVFNYSREPNTPAAKMGEQVPLDVASERCEEIMLAQQEVVSGFNESLKGRKLEAMVESMGEEGMYFGRTYMDAPEIDGAAIVRSGKFRPGDIARKEVVDSSDYDLILE